MNVGSPPSQGPLEVGGSLKRKKERNVLQRKQWFLSMKAAAGHIADELDQDILLIFDSKGEKELPLEPLPASPQR